jgi:hypothetical protein
MWTNSRTGHRWNTARRMRAGWLRLITFPRQQWLCERASLLRYSYISCLVPFSHSCHMHHSFYYRSDYPSSFWREVNATKVVIVLFSPTCCYFRSAERSMSDCRTLLFVTNQCDVETKVDHRQNIFKVGPDEDSQQIIIPKRLHTALQATLWTQWK